MSSPTGIKNVVKSTGRASLAAPALRLALPVAAVAVLDLLTKVWDEQDLPPHQPVPVVGEFLRLTLG